ncbi:unnamed protein product [Prunus armeniaca]
MKRVVDLRQGRVFNHKAIQQKKDGRSNRQASGTGVTPDDGSPMLKLASMGYTRRENGILHKVLMWDFVQITVVMTCVQGFRLCSWELRHPPLVGKLPLRMESVCLSMD